MNRSTPRGPWRVTASREAYTNPWLWVREDRVLGPDGRPGVFGVVEGPPFLAVVAVEAEERVYLVGQHRYAVGRYCWELPAGAAAAGEPVLAAAQRELREETGLRAARWTSLGRFHPSSNLSEAVGHLFLARGLVAVAAALRAALADPRHRAAAAVMGARVRADRGVQTARRLIEDLAAHPRPATRPGWGVSQTARTVTAHPP